MARQATGSRRRERGHAAELHHELRAAASGAHGVLRLVLELDGEVVDRTDPHIGLLTAAPRS